MNPRVEYEEIEKKCLAPFGQTSKGSLGRLHKEDECVFRPCFYRDLGRIVHSTAFRLLEYKTQVFVNHEGDYYRTRLTHTLEVGQISRGLARILRVNEDLANTIAFAHDLGHSPFGHSGEVALNELMEDEGGFEHNMQSYRVVTELEERYPDFKGLNLSYEVLEGILRHSTDYDNPKEAEGFKYVGHPTIEAQIVNFADEIAFMNHDLDDGLHWGMLSMNSLKEVPLWAETFADVEKKMPNSPERIKRGRTISNLIGNLIADIQEETKKHISERNIRTLADVRKNGRKIVSFSEGMRAKTNEAKDFLFKNVYRHKEVQKMSERGGIIVRDIFNAYLNNPGLLPEKFRTRMERERSKLAVCDYVAGMTDRFALQEHKKMFNS